MLSKPKNEHACSNHLTNHHDMACAKRMNQMSHNLTLMSGTWKTWDVNARSLRNTAQKCFDFVLGRLRMDVSILFSQVAQVKAFSFDWGTTNKDMRTNHGNVR